MSLIANLSKRHLNHYTYLVPKISNIKHKRFESLLYKSGWELKRQNGSHKIFHHKEYTETIVVPYHLGKDVPPYVINDFLRTHKLTEKEFLNII